MSHVSDQDSSSLRPEFTATYTTWSNLTYTDTALVVGTTEHGYWPYTELGQCVKPPCVVFRIPSVYVQFALEYSRFSHSSSLPFYPSHKLFQPKTRDFFRTNFVFRRHPRDGTVSFRLRIFIQVLPGVAFWDEEVHYGSQSSTVRFCLLRVRFGESYLILKRGIF